MSEVMVSCGKLSGRVIVPPSKSVAHRMIIASGLTGGNCTVSNVSFSEDILATIGAMKKIGAKIEATENSVKFYGRENVPFDKTEIFCNESGSTLRFMIPICLSLGGTFLFSGSKTLLSRPLDAYFEICKQDGISYEKTEKGIFFNGKLKGGEYKLRGDVSSQYITGLLFALSLLEKDSKITLTSKLESKGYVDLTIDVLSQFGVKIECVDDGFIIKGNQRFFAKDTFIEGDYSQAAFYLVANALGSDVEVLGLNESSKQGDKEIIEIIDKLQTGGKVIDASQIPDLVPIITVLATQTEGKTEIVNAKRLRIKESDRLSSITEELTKMGAKIIENPDGLEILGKTKLKGTTVYAHNDHRIAMSLAIASLCADGETVITDSECVKKSYGNFWEDFFSLKK